MSSFFFFFNDTATTEIYTLSLHDALPISCGLPVVAGNSGGVPDAVRDGETGLLVPPEDPAALADAVCRVLGDRELAGRLGRNGRRAVETYFNWDRVVRDLRAIEAEAAS